MTDDLNTRAREWVQRSRETWQGTTPGPWSLFSYGLDNEVNATLTDCLGKQHPNRRIVMMDSEEYATLGIDETGEGFGPDQCHDDARAIAAAPTEAQEAREIIEALLEQNAALTAQVEVKDKALSVAKEFIGWVNSMYGTGLEVANWHLNGDTEPLDNFIDENDGAGAEDAVTKALALTPADALAQREREARIKAEKSWMESEKWAVIYRDQLGYLADDLDVYDDIDAGRDPYETVHEAMQQKIEAYAQLYLDHKSIKADLARVTEERDRYAAMSTEQQQQVWMAESSRADQAEAERDEALAALAEMRSLLELTGFKPGVNYTSPSFLANRFSNADIKRIQAALSNPTTTRAAERWRAMRDALRIAKERNESNGNPLFIPEVYEALECDR